MSLHVVIHPRFGDTARVASDEQHRPQLLAEIGSAGAVSIEVDSEPGSTELAAQFARSLAVAALRFAERCEESIPDLARPVMCGDGSPVCDL
jgi:hypothetical protein